MKIVTAFNTISKQVVKHGNELKKLEYDMNAGATGAGGAGTTWVQLHDWPTPQDLAAGLTAPANTTVPKKSWASAAGAPNNYKDFTRGEMSFPHGVFVCVSTTQATLTLGTGNNKFDMVSAEVIGEETPGTEVQDHSVDNKEIWATGTGPKTLIRAAARNLEAGVRYLMLFAASSYADGDAPIRQWRMAANGDSAGGDILQLNFGGAYPQSGLSPYTKSAAGVVSVGCYFVISTTTKVLTQSFDVGMDIYAEYF